jgi:hypothetical protein
MAKYQKMVFAKVTEFCHLGLEKLLGLVIPA